MSNFTGAYILEIIFLSAASVNETLPEEKKIAFSESVDIFGPTSHIDSLSFVNLIVGIEELLFEKEGLEVNLLDVVAEIDNDFKSISDLLCLIQNLLNR